MMVCPKIAEYLEWINEDTSNSGVYMFERGLKPDAPQEAIDAYEEYCNAIKAAEERGDRL